ncbi:hypothetical protein CPLU01_08170 [Colletotrichum plurivorum]|uniref:Uncharacterized protein n=1 Tax=Colletotrichum plurivorum TaxID=2175906 RepID=A0A8H6NDZ7_9PEZI|nr:hypothetical protein CPLU01_08170 [Colletotrichum plurivorum]
MWGTSCEGPVRAPRAPLIRAPPRGSPSSKLRTRKEQVVVPGPAAARRAQETPFTYTAAPPNGIFPEANYFEQI